MNPDQPGDFWNITLTHVSVDYKAKIDYILYKTGLSQLYFVGYSFSTSSFMPLLTENPSYNGKIKVASLLAPAIFLNNMGLNGSAFETLLNALWVFFFSSIFNLIYFILMNIQFEKFIYIAVR